MTNLTKNLCFALLGLTVTLAGTNVEACGGRRGGYSGGISYARPSISYSRPSSYYSQPAIHSQPIAQQRLIAQPPQQRFVQQQPLQQPVQTAQVQQPVQTQVPQTQVPQTNANAQQSALDMLSAFTGDTTAATTNVTTPQQPAAFNGVGNWTATLTNGATVALNMQQGGAFTWTAVKNGKQSQFSGTFALNGNALTLNRSDNQKLTGTLTNPNTNGFTFKLNGVKDNGLQFASR